MTTIEIESVVMRVWKLKFQISPSDEGRACGPALHDSVPSFTFYCLGRVLTVLVNGECRGWERNIMYLLLFKRGMFYVLIIKKVCSVMFSKNFVKAHCNKAPRWLLHVL